MILLLVQQLDEFFHHFGLLHVVIQLIDLLDLSLLFLVKEEWYLLVLLIKKDLLHVIGKELMVLVDILLLVDGLLNLFLVYILLRMGVCL
jgi:hypothetical protein